MQISLRWRRRCLAFFSVTRCSNWFASNVNSNACSDSATACLIARVLSFCCVHFTINFAISGTPSSKRLDIDRRLDHRLDRRLDRIEGIEVTEINCFRIINICCLRNDRLRERGRYSLIIWSEIRFYVLCHQYFWKMSTIALKSFNKCDSCFNFCTGRILI